MKATKKDLAEAVYRHGDITRAQAARAVDDVFNEIEKLLAENSSVSILGFGTFEVRPRQGRDGHNPNTGESVYIADTVVPCFRAGSRLSEVVKENVSFEDASQSR